MDRATHARRPSVLRWILGFSVLSTALHFTHNFVAIDDYPDNLVSGALVQGAILVAWPLLTAIGLLGYRLYAQGRLPAALAFAVSSMRRYSLPTAAASSR